MYVKITFTYHAEYRLEKRKLLKQEILDALKYPDKIMKKHGLHYYQKKLNRGKIEIVCEKTEKDIKVITIYWL